MHDRWTSEEVKLLDKAGSFEELASIALGILERMSADGHTIVQICGPMSTGGLGDLALNMSRFEQAVEVATRAGLTVFNQMPFQDAMVRLSRDWDPNTYCMPILEVFYRKVFESGHLKKVLFLPDWSSSKGATWERNLSIELGIIVEEYPVEWLPTYQE